MKSHSKIILGLVFVACVFFFVRSCRSLKDYSQETRHLNKIVTSYLEKQGIKSSDLVEETHSQKHIGKLKLEYIQKKYQVRDTLDFVKIIEGLKEEVSKKGFCVFESRISYTKTKRATSLSIGKKENVLFDLEIIALGQREISSIKKEGKIALVLDDWGYNLNNLKSLTKIKYPLTISVLPNLAYSQKVSRAAAREGHEVILHLPLESHERKNMEEKTILCNMRGNEIIDIFNSSLNSTPQARGVSNHMGSKATEDRKTMSVIFKQMRKRNMFFLDSLVTERTICESLAQETSVKFAKRDIFLDNVADKDYIKNQLRKLVRLAKANGQAIGIGHDRRLTLEVLSEEMESLEKKGIKFVYLSEVLQ